MSDSTLEPYEPVISVAVADPELIEKLKQPVNSKFVSVRKGLSYVTGRYTKSRMNQLFGPDGWSYTIEESKLLHIDAETVRWYTRVKVNVHVTGFYAERDAVAVGHGTFKTKSGYCSEGRKNEIIDFAAAESVTDALKRACVGFGETLGLSLYPITSK